MVAATNALGAAAILQFFVQIGVLGNVGIFQANQNGFDRGAQVICRTERGLEIGRVLSVSSSAEQDSSDGQLLRAVTREDQLIIERLEKNRKQAIESCQEMLRTHQIRACLVDVEHLFDGSSLYFYFLGEIDPRLESLTSKLAEAYEAKARFRKFSERLHEGCGPDCGTKDCSSGGCSTCSLAGGCHSKSLSNSSPTGVSNG